MKIEPGYYKTRVRTKARVTCIDAPGYEPLVGYVLDEDDNCCLTAWTEDGVCGNNHDLDLVEPWREPVKYSIDFWVDKIDPDEKKRQLSLGITEQYIFGCNVCWPKPIISCPIHVRVTVEEVVDGND